MKRFPVGQKFVTKDGTMWVKDTAITWVPVVRDFVSEGDAFAGDFRNADGKVALNDVLNAAGGCAVLGERDELVVRGDGDFTVTVARKANAARQRFMLARGIAAYLLFAKDDLSAGEVRAASDYAAGMLCPPLVGAEGAAERYGITESLAASRVV